VVVILGLAAVTPPVGISCYIVSGVVEDVPLTSVFQRMRPIYDRVFRDGAADGDFPGHRDLAAQYDEITGSAQQRKTGTVDAQSPSE
jgi:hypothetical protein